MPKLSKFREEGQASQTMERLGVTKGELIWFVKSTQWQKILPIMKRYSLFERDFIEPKKYLLH